MLIFDYDMLFLVPCLVLYTSVHYVKTTTVHVLPFAVCSFVHNAVHFYACTNLVHIY